MALSPLPLYIFYCSYYLQFLIAVHATSGECILLDLLRYVLRRPVVTDAPGSSMPVWFMHQDKYGSKWNIQLGGFFVLVLLSSFSFPLHFILFKAQLSGTVCLCCTTARLCVCVCVCVYMCVSKCVHVYFCVMRRDKRLHPPLRRSIPQRSATRSVWRAFHLSSTRFLASSSPSSPPLIPSPWSASPRSHRWKKRCVKGMKGTRF